MSYGNNSGGGQPPQPKQKQRAPVAPPPPAQRPQGQGAQVIIVSQQNAELPEHDEEELLDPEEIELRIRFGALIGIAGVVLCCLPVGLFGMLIAASSLGPIGALPDPEEQASLKKKALTSLAICGGASLASLLGWGVALVAGC